MPGIPGRKENVLLRTACTIIVCVLTLAPLPAIPAGAVPPSPYRATYAVSYRGLNAGLLHFELRPKGDGLFVYETRAEPSFFARLFVGGSAVEHTLMRIDAGGVRPLFWFVEDGKPGDREDGELAFNWEEGEVSGTVKGEAVRLTTVPGLQDRLSIQIAVMEMLLRGDEPGTIPMVSDDKIRRYSYRRIGSGPIRTPAGEFRTILYESTRPGSSRLSRIWHAPALGYLPVYGEQERDGKVETVMELVQVERDFSDPAPAASKDLPVIP